MGVRCPKCGNTNEATIWEDNFWSGCNICGWSASCEHAVWVPSKTEPGVLVDYATWKKHYGYSVEEEE